MSKHSRRQVVGFPCYQVTRDGDIFRGGRQLKASPNDAGYRIVSLWSGGTRKVRKVSALVCEAFIGPRPDGCHVGHRNGIKTDDRLDNLAYITQVENEADKRLHGSALLGSRHHQSKLTENLVRQIRAEYRPKSKTHGRAALSKKYRVSGTTIQDAISGVTWSHV